MAGAGGGRMGDSAPVMLRLRSILHAIGWYKHFDHTGAGGRFGPCDGALSLVVGHRRQERAVMPGTGGRFGYFLQV